MVLSVFWNYPYRDSLIFRQLLSCCSTQCHVTEKSRWLSDARGRGGAPLLRQCYCFLNTWGLWSANRRPRETIPRGKEWKEIHCFPDNKEPCSTLLPTCPRHEPRFSLIFYRKSDISDVMIEVHLWDKLAPRWANRFYESFCIVILCGSFLTSAIFIRFQNEIR